MEKTRKDMVGEVLTRESLESYWDQVAREHGTGRAIGINLVTPIDLIHSNPGVASFMAFLPLYMVATFHKCQRCGACCRPNFRAWDKGVILSRDEALALRDYARITKRSGQQMLKYPCSLLKENNTCRHYHLRPYGCRLFPFTAIEDAESGQINRGIIMTCPAARELYVTAQLFIQDWYNFLEKSRRQGKQRFDISDLEELKKKYQFNEVDEKDLEYMKELARDPYRGVRQLRPQA